MDNPFLQAVFVQPRVVMGRELRPFSAYHAAALMLLDSPFIVAREDPPEPSDLILAAYICSFGFEDGPAMLFPEVDMAAIDEWADGCEAVDVDEEAAVFGAYLEDYLTVPELWQPDGDASETSGIPWPVYCVTAVLQNMRGITEVAAWDMPLNRLVAYKCAIAEQNGAEIVSQQERNFKEYFRRVEAAQAEEGDSDG